MNRMFNEKESRPPPWETDFQAKTDFPEFGKRIFKRKQTSQSSGNGFSNENRLPRVRETVFQAKTDFPEFGKQKIKY